MEEKSPQWEPSFYQAEPGCWAENIGKKNRDDFIFVDCWTGTYSDSFF